MTLKTDLMAAVIALATKADNRVFDSQIPPGVPQPFIAMMEIAASQPQTLSGAGLLRRSTIHIAIFTNDSKSRDDIAELLLNAFKLGFPKTIGSTLVASVRAESSADEISYSDGDVLIRAKGLDFYFVFY